MGAGGLLPHHVPTRDGVAGVVFQDAGELGVGLGGPARRAERQAQVGPRLGVLGIEGKGVAELLNRLWEEALGVQDNAQMVADVGVVAVQGEGLAELAGGFGVHPPAVQIRAQAGMERDVVHVRLGDPGEQGMGRDGVAGFVGGGRGVEVGGLEAFVQGQGHVHGGEGFIGLIRLVQSQAPVEVGFGIAGVDAQGGIEGREGGRGVAQATSRPGPTGSADRRSAGSGPAPRRRPPAPPRTAPTPVPPYPDGCGPRRRRTRQAARSARRLRPPAEVQRWPLGTGLVKEVYSPVVVSLRPNPNIRPSMDIETSPCASLCDRRRTGLS